MKTLREIPAVRALAEEQARGRWTLRCARRDCYPPWDPTFSACEDAIEVDLDLLCNLERPASCDAIARLIAEVIGWDAFDVTKAVESSAEMLAGLYRVAGLPELPRWEPVPPPAEALRLIAIAVLGGSRG